MRTKRTSRTEDKWEKRRGERRGKMDGIKEEGRRKEKGRKGKKERNGREKGVQFPNGGKEMDVGEKGKVRKRKGIGRKRRKEGKI